MVSNFSFFLKHGIYRCVSTVYYWCTHFHKCLKMMNCIAVSYGNFHKNVNMLHTIVKNFTQFV